MEIVINYPPMYKEIVRVLSPKPKTIYAWYDKIYNPSGTYIPKDLIIHEEVHMAQQGIFPATWWRQYLDYPEFRLDQEVEAYRAQYQYICLTNRDKNFQLRWLMGIAALLAGPMYGHLTTQPEALTLIRSA